MTSLADRTITELRRVYDDLADRVPTLTPEDLARPSGAEEWTVAQVLSHLGSAGEIRRAGLRAALTGADAPGPDFNPSVWDRWNALTPREQADGYLASEGETLELVEGLTADQREQLRVDVGFLPAPIPLATLTGMWLNEAAQHSWDVRVAFDAEAEVDAAAAAVVLEHLSGGLGFLLGFAAQVDTLPHPGVVALGDTGLSLTLGERAVLSDDAGPATASFNGGAGSAVRLLGGRLRQIYTPPGLTVEGDLDLDDLRRVFPGY